MPVNGKFCVTLALNLPFTGILYQLPPAPPPPKEPPPNPPNPPNPPPPNEPPPKLPPRLRELVAFPRIDPNMKASVAVKSLPPLWLPPPIFWLLPFEADISTNTKIRKKNRNRPFKDYENDVYYKLSEYLNKTDKIEAVFAVL